MYWTGSRGWRNWPYRLNRLYRMCWLNWLYRLDWSNWRCWRSWRLARTNLSTGNGLCVGKSDSKTIISKRPAHIFRNRNLFLGLAAGKILRWNLLKNLMKRECDLNRIAVRLRRKYVRNCGTQFPESHPHRARCKLRQNLAHRERDIHSGNHRLSDSGFKLHRQHSDNGR